jgi:hypothetical protein
VLVAGAGPGAGVDDGGEGVGGAGGDAGVDGDLVHVVFVEQFDVEGGVELLEEAGVASVRMSPRRGGASR